MEQPFLASDHQHFIMSVQQHSGKAATVHTGSYDLLRTCMVTEEIRRSKMSTEERLKEEVGSRHAAETCSNEEISKEGKAGETCTLKKQSPGTVPFQQEGGRVHVHQKSS